MLLAGYPNRRAPASETINNLWAKALVLEDPLGRRGAIVALDLEGIARDLSQTVCARLQKAYGLERRHVLINCSHTHSGPVVGHNLRAMHYDLADPHQKKLIDEYATRLEQQIVELVGEATKTLQPSKLAWGQGTATFAVNRRNNIEADVPKLGAQGQLKGPVDHDVPVLTVTAPNGRLTAVVFGYACHAAVLSGNQWSSDYPGFAETQLEANHPGCTALFINGCSGDQNPLPRGTVELAREYGGALTAAVEAVLSRRLVELPANLEAKYEEVELPFGTLPSKVDVERDTNSRNEFVASRARLVLKSFNADGKLPASYPYPVQVWRLGPLVLVALGGEAVVDYALRLKQELGGDKVWVAAYSNDVMAYIPSRRVLAEGGYEGAFSMLWYGLPGPWGPRVEEVIVKAVRASADATAKSQIDASDVKEDSAVR